MVLVFKTNIEKDSDIEGISPVLKSFREIISWSIDNEDVDNVLRIESTEDITNSVEYILNSSGYLCAELV